MAVPSGAKARDAKGRVTARLEGPRPLKANASAVKAFGSRPLLFNASADRSCRSRACLL